MGGESYELKVFISSVIKGFSQFREAAAEGVRTFSHKPIMAEDFPANPTTPQRACLQGVRQSDAMVLILGKRYGTIQATGLSATHEEYNAAKGQMPVYVFLEQRNDQDDEQRDFISSLGDWQSGHFASYFSSAAQLQRLVVQAISQSQTRTTITPAERDSLLERCSSLAVATSERDHLHHSGDTILSVAIVGHPTQQMIRPTTLASPRFQELIEQTAIYGDHRLFERRIATKSSTRIDALEVSQNNASIHITEKAEVRIRLNAIRRSSSPFMLGSLIEEDVYTDICRCLQYSDWLLEEIDSVHELQTLAVAATFIGAIDHVPWTTRAELNSNSATIPMRGNDGLNPAALIVSRSALKQSAKSHSEDLTVKLRQSLANVDMY